jgi:carotenoid 1,2-hydratase
VGSVFSPYYAWSGRRDPLDHCAINIALYGNPGARWAMTERKRSKVTRSDAMFQVGQSSLRWCGDSLEIVIDEVGAPIPKRIRGLIRVTPSGFVGRSFALDPWRRHVWQPIAPRARIDVMLDRPGKSWSGTAYLDSNCGAEPLEAGFREWTWSRAHLAQDTVVFYDALRNDKSDVSMAFRFDPSGHVRTVAPPARTALPSTAWRVSRNMRADARHTVTMRRTLEDTPFYARTHIAAQIFGEQAECFHESLSLERFASPLVRAMLPFRMPRSPF